MGAFRRIAFLLLTLAPFWAAASDFEFDEEAVRAYEAYFKLKMGAADRHFALLRSQPKGKGVELYLANYRETLLLLASDDPDLLERLRGKESERLDALARLDRASPWFRFVDAEIRIQWALVHLKFGNQLPAFSRLRKAHALLKDNFEEYPDFEPHYKSMGFLKIVFASMPEGYHWVFSLFGMEGDAESGLAMLDRAIGDGSGAFSTEAAFMKYMCMALALDRKGEALAGLQDLQRRHPDNLLLCGAGAMVALEARQAAEALRMIETAPGGEDYLYPPFVHYMKGDVLLRTGRYERASASFRRFLKLTKGRNYVKDAYYRLFLAEWFQGAPEAERYLKLARERGATETPADRYALAFAEREALPDRRVTRARLLFDGGEYGQALTILRSVPPTSLPRRVDRVELRYRIGRALQEMGRSTEAVAAFEQAVGEDDPADGRYYAPNAALQIGLILQAQGDCGRAKRWFRFALDYPSHTYKASIDRKAEAALSGCP